MKYYLYLLLLFTYLLSLSSCSTREIVSVTAATVTGDVTAVGRLAARKGVYYVTHPQVVARRVREFTQMLARFHKAISPTWGENEAREPSQKRYVKYTQNYLSRAEVDFDRGRVLVETLDEKNPTASLKSALVTVFLTPADPRSVDLYSDSKVVLGETPFLYGEVLDRDNKPIRWEWRATRFADALVRDALKTRQIRVDGRSKTVSYVTVPMVRDHLMVRARKFKPYVQEYAKTYGVSPNLIYAIMKTESDFNPYAVSHVPAFGLMQIVPASAGQDVSGFLDDRQGVPSQDFLFIPRNNIRYGAAYLHILKYNYLAQISDPLSREYCVIAAYNGGAGSVLRTFDSNRNRASAKVNSMHPGTVYNTLTTKHPAEETRRYVRKVLRAKKDFVNL